MAEVKWIKIVTDIFDDEKIKYIETMPNGDTTIVIWFRLMCLAGKSNHAGVLMMTDRIAYTDEMLSSIFNRDIKVIQLALRVFESLGMIEITENRIYLSNWEKHQNTEKLARIREQTRERVAQYRQKRLECNDVTQDVTQEKRPSNAIELELELDKDIEEEKKKDVASVKPKKNTFGQYEHVKLTDEEHAKLIKDYSDSVIQEAIAFLDAYIEEKAYKAKNHNLTIRRWVIQAVEEARAKKAKAGGSYKGGRVDVLPDYSKQEQVTMTEEEKQEIINNLKSLGYK